ncbi:unnamed protein product [Schistocephalus solidus]|uniref:Uncharacterized protein n=1 Tax=Schistocephalus solidus TaxID=70667 RepID=A0A183SL90_SCHSO|nr:unnamed protein product [Schistocephalus solidus]
MVPNSHFWLLEGGFFPAATPRATVTTGGLNQGRVSGVVFASTPDNPRRNWPERRTALLTRELARYKVDIAAFSKTRFFEQGQLEEMGASYTFFWSGRPKAELRDAGIAFAIRHVIVGRMPCLPQGINDRLMSLRLPLRKPSHTDQHFLPPSDAGEGHVDAPSIAALAAAGLCSHPEARLTGHAGNQGDPRCRWLDRSPPHHLPDEAPTSTPTKAPSNQITEKLEDLHAPDDNATVETRWCQLRNVIQSTALDVLGRARRRHQDWFDDNYADISNLLADKNGQHKAYMDLRTDATKAAFSDASALNKNGGGRCRMPG